MCTCPHSILYSHTQYTHRGKQINSNTCILKPTHTHRCSDKETQEVLTFAPSVMWWVWWYGMGGGRDKHHHFSLRLHHCATRGNGSSTHGNSSCWAWCGVLVTPRLKKKETLKNGKVNREKEKILFLYNYEVQLPQIFCSSTCVSEQLWYDIQHQTIS